MDEIHVHKTKKSICAHFAESPCISKAECPRKGKQCVNGGLKWKYNKPIESTRKIKTLTA